MSENMKTVEETKLLLKSAEKNMRKVLACLNKDQQIEILNNSKPYIYERDGKTYILLDAPNTKVMVGDDYNYTFDKTNGNFARFGKTYDDDPNFSPVFAEIIDIEITTKCDGAMGLDGIRRPCSFCYKSNTPKGINMSFEDFKTIIDKAPKTVTQIAFGADSRAISNPDLWKMAEYSRSLGIIPNITIAEASDEVADKLASVMGAVAVSIYDDKNVCYDTIKKLTDRKMNQINIHCMISGETYDRAVETINDMVSDPRLKGMNAIVLLSLKEKGRGVGFKHLTKDQYNSLVNMALDKGVNFGFDSCGCRRFFDAVKDHKDYEKFKVVGEPCESLCFSWYISAEGKSYPCSFCEEISGWEDGIDVVNAKNLIEEVWYSKASVSFRDKLLANTNNCHGVRECPIYEI